MSSTRSLRLLVLGIDGADPGLIQSFVRKGYLPNFRKLIDSGHFAPLKSTIPATTYPAWTSFFTGTEPSWHGVPDFTIRQGYDVRFIGAGERRGTTWMEHLEAEGLKVGMAWFPVSYPPLKLNGFHISGWDSPVTSRGDQSFVHPPGLYSRMLRRFGSQVFEFDSIDEFSDDTMWYEKAAAKLLKRIEQKTEAAGWLLEQCPVDVAAFYFSETDTAAHHFWAFHDSDSPRSGAGNSETLKHTLKDVYCAIDSAIGQLLSVIDSETKILIVSDHGSMGNSDLAIHLNTALASGGYLKFKPSGKAPGNGTINRSAVARLVPPVLRRRLFNAAGDFVESRYRFSGIDWRHTIAFSEETPYAPAVWLNQLGREPHGTIQARDRESVLSEIESSMNKLRFDNGEQVFKKIYRREQLHTGPMLHLFPDLIMDFNYYKGYLPICQKSSPAESRAMTHLSPGSVLGRKGTSMPGGHASHGIYISDQKTGSVGKHPSINDMFQVICDLADVWPPGVTQSKEPVMLGVLKRNNSGYSYKEQQNVAKRLKRLGYLDD